MKKAAATGIVIAAAAGAALGIGLASSSPCPSTPPDVSKLQNEVTGPLEGFWFVRDGKCLPGYRQVKP